MSARVGSLVEDYNQVRQALARTRVEQAETRRQVLAAAASCRGPGASSAGGSGRSTPAAPRAAIDRVDRLRRQVEAPCSGASVRIASIGRGDDIGAVRPTG
jgi:hypothetical protein